MDQDFQRLKTPNETPMAHDVEPRSTSNQSPRTPTIAAEGQADTTSSTTTRLVMLFAGLSALCSSSYLAGRVLYRLLVEKDSSFLFFDLSSFDLYVVISLTLFTVVYFLAAYRTEENAQTAPKNSASSTISAIWQALLIIILVGSVISLIYSPISASIRTETASKNTGSMIAYEMLSAVFVALLAGTFLFREWLSNKSRSTLIPTIVTIVLILAVLIPAVVFILQPKERKQYDPYYSSQSTYDLSDRAEDSTAASSAAMVMKKAEAYNTIYGEYPATIADFAKAAESKLDSNYTVTADEPTTADTIQYKRCSTIGAQVTHYVTSTNTTKITGLGGASSSVAC